MQERAKYLMEWAIGEIKKNYLHDVDLLIGVEGHETKDDGHGICFDYFIPASEKGNDLARTFIVEGIGYDLYPRSWERMEMTADLEDPGTLCIANATILYSRSESERKRFLKLQQRFFEHLKDESFMYAKALERLQDVMGIYQRMLFEEQISKSRMAAGFVFSYLTDTVAYLNGTYVDSWSEGQYAFLLKLKERAACKVPQGLLEGHEKMLRADSVGEIRECCHGMIQSVRAFALEKKKKQRTGNSDFKNLAQWYQEISLWWRRLYIYCEQKNAAMAYAQACALQNELCITAEEFCLQEHDLLGNFSADNLMPLLEAAKNAEQYIRSEIENHGAEIEEYPTLNAFIEKNISSMTGGL